ncbi:hypothetical protein [Ottowia thiooxydans]|uniref:hypothetical protein n=1 Tax=Ottowia thiooxydans TaxID=219182 RepID=UPI00041D8343|nr:hypothetical protein [Ottowia thiooxydans]
MTDQIGSSNFSPHSSLLGISSRTLDQVKIAQDRVSIGSTFSRAWDAIKDFFSTPYRAEAKRCLFDLYSQSTSDQEKLVSFERLKELSGDGHAHCFDTGISYLPKRDGGFFKVYDLKINFGENLEAFAFHMEGDCVEAEEIISAYAPLISDESKDAFAKCIEKLYKSPEALFLEESNKLGSIAIPAQILWNICRNNSACAVKVDIVTGIIGFEDEKFPQHGSPEVFKAAMSKIKTKKEENQRELRELIVANSPAPIFIDQKNEASRVLLQYVDSNEKLFDVPQEYNFPITENSELYNQSSDLFERDNSMIIAIDNEIWDLPKEISSHSKETFKPEKSLGNLLDDIYSHQSSTEDKRIALLTLKSQIKESESVKFEIAEYNTDRVGSESFAIAKIRMVFPMNEGLSPVEIIKVQANMHQDGDDAKIGTEPKYVTWHGGWSSNPLSSLQGSSSFTSGLHA